MKKRLFLIIILILFLTGCSATYEIEFVDETIKEKTSILIDASLADKNVPIIYDGLEDTVISKTYRQHLESNYKEKSYAFLDNTKEIYKKKKINNDQYAGIEYIYQYNVNNFSKSTNANFCYKLFNFLNSKDLYVISTDKTCNCFSEDELDNLTIHLKSNHKVKDNNADRVEGYNYYWDINRNNYKNKSIYIELYKDKYIFNYENRIIYGLIGFAAGLLVILIVFVIMRRKTKNNNKI